MHAVCGRRATVTTLTLAAHAHAVDRIIGSRASAASVEMMAVPVALRACMRHVRMRGYDGTHLGAPVSLARTRHAAASLSTAAGVAAGGAAVGGSRPPSKAGEGEPSTAEKVKKAILAFAERDTDVNTPLPALRYPSQAAL
jgi:hypothetical protein